MVANSRNRGAIMADKSAFDVYQAVTDRIIVAIDAGTGEARMPWHRSGQSTLLPKNDEGRQGGDLRCCRQGRRSLRLPQSFPGDGGLTMVMRPWPNQGHAGLKDNGRHECACGWIPSTCLTPQKLKPKSRLRGAEAAANS